MGIRIMQLQFEAGKREAKIVDGYEMWLSARIVRRNTFGAAGDGIIISSLYTSEEKRNVTTVHGVNVRKLGDEFKEIILAGVDVKVEEENQILLLIDTAVDFVQGEKINKIAGRYESVGAFLLNPEEKITISRGGLKQTFVALQFEKKMYLCKVHD